MAIATTIREIWVDGIKKTVVDPTMGTSILDFPVSVDPRLGGSAGAGTANNCYFSRVTGSGLISGLRITVGTSSGNISLAVYDTTGTGSNARPNAQLVTTGAIACPAGAATTTVKFATATISNGGSSVSLQATTIPVVSTTAFPSSGILLFGSTPVFYTGKTSTTFTGCFSASSGSAADGSTCDAAVNVVHMQHWFAFSVDNATATIQRYSMGAATGVSTLANGLSHSQTSAHPAPNPAVTTGPVSFIPVLAGV